MAAATSEKDSSQEVNESPSTSIENELNSAPSSLKFQHLAAELRLYCGDDSFDALAHELKRSRSTRAVLVCPRSVAGSEAIGLLRERLGAVLVGETSAVRPNSPLSFVVDVARTLADLEADAIVAVGGGSAAVTARVASILLAEKLDARELCTRRQPDGEFVSPRLAAPKLPQFVVPTTPSTAFVKAGSAVLDDKSGERLAFFDPKTRAKAVFLHPALLRTAPAKMVSEASLNTLSTAVEALESPQCDPVSEAMLVHSLRLLQRHLGDVSGDRADAGEHLAVAAVLCGRGTEQSGGGLASVLAHAIGHRLHIANGIVNAIVLPHTMRFNASAAAVGHARIVDALQAAPTKGRPFVNGTSPAVDALESVLDKLSMPRRLREIGLPQQDLAPIAVAAMSDWFIRRSPRRVNGPDDLRKILEAAW